MNVWYLSFLILQKQILTYLNTLSVARSTYYKQLQSSLWGYWIGQMCVLKHLYYFQFILG